MPAGNCYHVTTERLFKKKTKVNNKLAFRKSKYNLNCIKFFQFKRILKEKLI